MSATSWDKFAEEQSQNIVARYSSNRQQTIDPTSFEYFGSCASQPYCNLSNFAETEFNFQGNVFISSEHAYQAWKLRDPSILAKAPYNDFCSGLAKVFFPKGMRKDGPGKEKDEKLLAKKMSGVSWGPRGKRRAMVGIIAKMAVNKDHCISESQHRGRSLGQGVRIFFDILKAKYEQDEELRELLLSTGEKALVEFDRQARSGSRWAALVDEEKGELYGGNLQGEIQMAMRTWFSNQQRSSTKPVVSMTGPRQLEEESAGNGVDCWEQLADASIEEVDFVDQNIVLRATAKQTGLKKNVNASGENVPPIRPVIVEEDQDMVSCRRCRIKRERSSDLGRVVKST